MGNQTSSLPFSIDQEVSTYSGVIRNGWRLFHGERKSNGELVSVLKFERRDHKKAYNKDQLWDMALNFYKRVKTLRHPYILNYIDGIEAKDMLIIVTERVVPLKEYIQTTIFEEPKNSMKNMIIAWGFHCLLQALKFVNTDCNLLHGGIASESVFVTLGGDFKLAGFFVTEKTNSYRNSPGRLFCENSEIVSREYFSPERKSGSWETILERKDATDVFGLGCILIDCFVKDPSEYSSGKMKEIPPLLRKVLSQMLDPKASARPTAQEVYNSSGFTKAFNNKYVKTLQFLEESQIKSEIEKLDFLKELDKDVTDFPSSSAFYKFLPALSEMHHLSSMSKPQNMEGVYEVSHTSLILSIAIKLWKKTGESEDKKLMMLPLITNMFDCNDRQTRIILLQNLALYVNDLQMKVINKDIFPKIIAGFSDNTVALREITLKSMIILAPRLSESNLNDKLVKVVLRLLDDPEPSLVTNTVVCFSKLLCHFSNKTMPKIVAAVFPKALRSPHQHTRLAALRGICSSVSELLPEQKGSLSTKELESAKLCVSKLLPAASFSLLDSAPEIRKEAFESFDFMLKKMKGISDRMNLETNNDSQDDSNDNSYLSTATKWASSLQRNISYDQNDPEVPEDATQNSPEATDDEDVHVTEENGWDKSESDNNSHISDNVADSVTEDLLGMNTASFDMSNTARSNLTKSKSPTQLAQDILEEDDFFKNF